MEYGLKRSRMGGWDTWFGRARIMWDIVGVAESGILEGGGGVTKVEVDRD